MNDAFEFNVRRPRCVCGKVSFDKKTAATKSNSLHLRGNGKGFGIYQCPKSNTWHLTKHVKGNERRKGFRLPSRIERMKRGK
jgi:hypothetical protein